MTRNALRGRGPCATLVLLAAGGVLAACSGSLFQSRTPPTSVYLLSAERTSAPAAASAGTSSPVIPADLAVLRPRVRAGLETDRIAVLYPDRHLDYFANARWSGPLADMMQDLALQAFHTGSNLRNVSADASAFASAYWLELEVADFEADYTSDGSAPSIRVHLLARLGRSGDRRVVAAFDADVTRKASANRLSSIVDAYQSAAGAALADVVANTVRTVAQNNSSPVASDSR
jgi:ABC-type uncharacterized transport system auxiliary subunit